MFALKISNGIHSVFVRGYSNTDAVPTMTDAVACAKKFDTDVAACAWANRYLGAFRWYVEPIA